MKPPYSRITALDLNTGEYAWWFRSARRLSASRSIPALAGITLPNTGGIGLHATLLVTKTLLIAGEGWGGSRSSAPTTRRPGLSSARSAIPGQMGSMPMTYMVNGKQYIAFTVGAPTDPAELVALALD